MKTWRLALALGIVALLFVPARAQNLEADLQRAIQKETTSGDLKAAIEDYRRIFDRAGTNRPVAAQALLRQAECHEKLGDAEAQKLYAQIIKDFGDQSAIAAQAKARLVGPPAPLSRGQRETDREVWATTERDFAPDFVTGPVSADGRMVAFVTRSSPNTGNLFVHDLVTGTDRVVALPAADLGRGPGTAFSSAFSRDGRWLAYQVSVGPRDARRYQIQVVDVRVSGNAPPRTLLDLEAVPYDWTPDGKWIAVRARQEEGREVVGLVSVDDGSLRVLKTSKSTSLRRTDFGLNVRGTPSLLRAELNGFLSPDGRLLAIETPEDASKARDILVLPIDGSPEIPVVTFKGDDRLMGWSPDGSVLFTSERAGSIGIWRQRIQGGRRQGDPEVIRRGLVQSESLGVTSSGALYYVMRNQPGSTVKEAAFDFDAGQFITDPRDLAETFVRSNMAPRWSPDGMTLAYVSVRSARASDHILVTRALPTGEVREWPIDFFFKNDNRNLWDWIDNQSIWVVGEDAEHRTGFHRVNILTGQLSPLLLLPPEAVGIPRTPPFVPGGRAIRYNRPRSAVNAGTPVEVERDLVSWIERENVVHQRQPDGTKTYAVRASSGGSRVIVERDASSGAERELLRLAPYRGIPDQFLWHLTADGRSIVAATADPATGEGLVVLCSVDDGTVKELFRARGPGASSREVVLQLRGPGDRSVLVQEAGGPGGVAYWWVPLDGRSPKPLNELAGLAVDRQNGRDAFELHPDGRRLVFSVDNPGYRGDQLRVLENFLPTVSGRGAGGR